MKLDVEYFIIDQIKKFNQMINKNNDDKNLGDSINLILYYPIRVFLVNTNIVFDKTTVNYDSTFLKIALFDEKDKKIKIQFDAIKGNVDISYDANLKATLNLFDKKTCLYMGIFNDKEFYGLKDLGRGNVGREVIYYDSDAVNFIEQKTNFYSGMSIEESKLLSNYIKRADYYHIRPDKTNNIGKIPISELVGIYVEEGSDKFLSKIKECLNSEKEADDTPVKEKRIGKWPFKRK